MEKLPAEKQIEELLANITKPVGEFREANPIIFVIVALIVIALIGLWLSSE